MHMVHQFPRWVLAVLLTGTAMAQESAPDPANPATAAVRKQPGWFSRPAKINSAQQLAYANQLWTEGHTRAARKAYLALIQTWHDSAEAPAAQYAYAQILESSRKYFDAFDEYQYLIEFYSGRFPHTEVVGRQLAIARHLITTPVGRFWFFPGVHRPERALPMLEKIVKNAPDWEKTADVYILIGMIHEEQRDQPAAIRAYETAEQSAKSSPLAEEAAYRRCCCLNQIADLRRRDEASQRDALSAMAGFVTKYPQSKALTAVQGMMSALKDRLAVMLYERALFYDRAHKPEAALIAYADLIKQFPQSAVAEQARERVDELKRLTENKTR